MRLLALALPACFLLVALAGCESEENESKAGTCQDVASDVKTIEIHVGSNAAGGGMYLKATPGLNADKGQKVRFKVTNDDKMFHDVVLKNYAGQNYEHEVDAGTTKCTFTGGQPYFVASATGSYDIYCEVADHKAAGMSGTFVVT